MMNDKVKVIQCEEAIQKMLEYLDEELQEHDHKEVHNHLDSCRECFTRMEFEQRLKGMINNAESKTAPSSLNCRINKIIKSY